MTRGTISHLRTFKILTFIIIRIVSKNVRKEKRENIGGTMLQFTGIHTRFYQCLIRVFSSFCDKQGLDLSCPSFVSLLLLPQNPLCSTHLPTQLWVTDGGLTDSFLPDHGVSHNRPWIKTFCQVTIMRRLKGEDTHTVVVFVFVRVTIVCVSMNGPTGQLHQGRVDSNFIGGDRLQR